MAAELDSNLKGFGSKLKKAAPGGSPEKLGEALAADLNAHSGGKPLTLFVDEFDRIPLDTDLKKFTVAVVSNLAPDVQLAISSRHLSFQPWYNLVSSGDAVVLGTEYRKNDVMFTVEHDEKPRLEVYSLGRGYALVNGHLITNWDGALPRNLFFFFMDNPLVTRDQIFEIFWPNLSVKEATNVFHVTKRKISERISMKVDETGSYELTQYASGFYTPSDKVVRYYDVFEFQESVEQSMTAMDDEQEEELLTKAIELYKAPFLETIEMDWVVERRNSLRQLYSQALISMGRINKRRENLPGALGCFNRALKETPEREDIHREVMNLYIKMSQPREARAQYDYLKRILRETLNIDPSRESQELFKLIP
jgi:two-component SAPR family response regulator